MGDFVIYGTILTMGNPEQYSTHLGARGRLVLPAALRRSLGLHPGDRLILTVEPDGGFRVTTAGDLARRLFGLFRDLAPGHSLADDLIADRRDEVRREAESP